MFYNFYHMDENNIGDMNCSPCLYFSFLKDKTKLCDLSLPYEIFIQKYKNLPKGSIIILGGGGCISPKQMPRKINYLLQLKIPIIIWGCGANDHGSTKLEYLDFSKCLLVGTRDYTNQYEYVPCVSCMSDLFDNKIETKYEFVIYEHKDYPIEGCWPKIKNNKKSFKEVINFLGSGDIVVTSSYHGVYWSFLLGKKVICHPFSSKFYGFKNKLKFERVNPSPNNFLEECREININFFKKIKAYSVKI